LGIQSDQRQIDSAADANGKSRSHVWVAAANRNPQGVTIVDNYSKRAATYVSTKLTAIGSALFVALMLMGCGERTITFSGTVVTYEHVELDRIRLTYFVTTKNMDEELQRGTAAVDGDGNFKIRIRQQEHLPYWLVIDGVEGVPEVSIFNNAHEVTEKRETEKNIGEIYIYDYIKILDDFSSPVTLKNLAVHWQSNIPDVDFYKVELVGAISISGIKEDSFSFATIAALLEKQGQDTIGEIEITKRRELIEGGFFLDIKAQRIVSGTTITIGGSERELVTIVQE
jgi:hypothetical protein